MKVFILIYLFTAEVIDNEIKDFFLQELPVLQNTDRDLCDVCLNNEEIINSLKSMENNKSPGPDGLTKEF